LFTGTVGALGEQLNDFEPGIEPSGLFWTIPIDSDALSVHPQTGVARYHQRNLVLNDYHDFFNAVAPDPDPTKVVPSVVSFDARWEPNGDDVVHTRDPDFRYEGRFVPTKATISFTVRHRNGDFAARSDPGEVTSVLVSAVGRERNGVFFR
jgi:hypothetical protein